MKKEKKMKREAELADCPLKKHTPATFGLAFLLGVFIGLAVIIPGISGSTVAIIFGMYTAMLYAIGNIISDFKRCVAYLLPIGLGAVIGFLGGFLVVQKVFGAYMFILVCLFAGLMIGAIPVIANEVKGEVCTPTRSILVGLGVMVPIAVGVGSIFLGEGTGADTFTSFPPYLFLLYIPLGAVVSATQIIPGLSATAVLMACGQFKPILNSLHLDYILENPVVIGLYLCIGGGFIVGLVLISKGFSAIIKKYRGSTFYFVFGLSLGSILSMFINPDMAAIYSDWSQNGISVIDLCIGLPLLLIGFVLSFSLARYELKRKEK